MAKVVLIAPFFEPALSFQEWVLAKYLALGGHEVTVITSTVEEHPEKNREILRSHSGITVHRLRCVGAGSTLFPLSTRRVRSLCSGQDAAVVNAPNHGFGYRALRVLPRTLPAAVGFGDLLDNRVTMKPLIRWWKDRWYRWLFDRADRLTCNTAECLGILEEIGLGRHASRIEVAGLPYDEDFFYLDEEYARPRLADRSRFLITITRPLPHKPFDKWLPPVFDFLRCNPSWSYRFAGLGDDAPAQQIRDIVASSGFADRVELLPMQDQAGIRRLYSGADLGLFPRATIGIQQAMATGLPVILPQKLTVSHLVSEGRNGFFYDSLEDASRVLSKAASHPWPERGTLAAENARWSGGRYATFLLKGLF
jgi:glycosyltransferase involved in cell wall biosynthesis